MRRKLRRTNFMDPERRTNEAMKTLNGAVFIYLVSQRAILFRNTFPFYANYYLRIPDRQLNRPMLRD